MTEGRWTMIGLMAAVFFGTMTPISTMFTRVVRSGDRWTARGDRAAKSVDFAAK